jgi:hypothetical protein
MIRMDEDSPDGSHVAAFFSLVAKKYCCSDELGSFECAHNKIFRIVRLDAVNNTLDTEGAMFCDGFAKTCGLGFESDEAEIPVIFRVVFGQLADLHFQRLLNWGPECKREFRESKKNLGSEDTFTSFSAG